MEVALFDAGTKGILFPQVILRAGVAMISGFAEPEYGLNRILGNAFALTVENGEVPLGFDVVMSGGFLQPVSRFNQVEWDTEPDGIERGEIVLSIALLSVGGEPETAHSFRKIFRQAVA